MMPTDHLALLTPLDFTALTLTVLGWLCVGIWIERERNRRPSVTVLMMEYRRDWMVQMITRDPRIFDAHVLGSLRQGTSFFASTCVIAIGGVLALVGNADSLVGVASELGERDIPAVIWQLKLVPVALFLTSAFLKFVWANRLFGYCAVVMAAVPNAPDSPEALPRAAQAAELNIRAALNFNRGLRAMYFALAAVAWLLGPFALIAATVGTLWLLWSREFASQSRNILVGTKP